MASAAPALALAPTEDDANHFRLLSLLVNGGQQALKSQFDRHFPPASLLQKLQSQPTKGILQKPNVKKHLKKPQKELLSPPSGQTPDSATFDVTLLALLLLNVCGLQPPITGRDGQPRSSDRSVEADIVRLRKYRNEFLHRSRTGLQEQEFNLLWQDIEEVIMRLGSGIPGLQQSIDSLYNACLDPAKEKRYLSIIQQWEDMDRQLIEDVKKLTERMDAKDTQLDVVVERLDSLGKDVISLERRHEKQKQKQAQTMLPELRGLCSRSEIFLTDVMSNKETFVKTRAFKRAEDTLKNDGLLVLSGSPGEGKTTLAVHLMMENWSLERCLVVKRPEDWSIIDFGLKAFDVVLIDDMFGEGTLNESWLSFWVQGIDFIIKAAKQEKARFIITTRHYVLEECKQRLVRYKLFRSQDKVQVLSAGDLSREEKSDMFRRHLKQTGKTCSELQIMQCVSAYSWRAGAFGFPELVRLYANAQESLYSSPEEFFESPDEFFDKLVNEITQNKNFFLSLLVVWASEEGFVTQRELKEKSKNIANIADAFQFPSGTVKEVQGNMAAHRGGLLKYFEWNGSFRFSHNVIKDMVGLLAAKENPDATIKFCTKDFFMEYIKSTSSRNTSQQFVVKPHLFSILADKAAELLLSSKPNNRSFALEMNQQQRGWAIQLENNVDLSILMHEVFRDFRFVRVFFLTMSQNRQHLAQLLKRYIGSIHGKLRSSGVMLQHRRINLIGLGFLYFGKDSVFVKEYFHCKALQEMEDEQLRSRYLQLILLFALEEGDMDLVRSSLGAGAAVDGNALYIAAFHGNAKALSTLLQTARVDINEKANGVNGNNALTVAAKRQHVDCVRCLLENKADPSVKNEAGRTALDKAIWRGNEDICQLLIKAGAPLTYRVGDLKRTPLHVAADRGLVKTVECLLKKQVDNRIKDKRGQLAIHCAAMQGRAHVVRALLEHDREQGNLRASTYGTYSRVKGLTPFHYAARKGFSDVVEVLLELNMDPDVRDAFGNTPANLAASYGHVDVLKRLVGRADLNTANKQGNTPLHTATFRNQEKCVKFFCLCPSVDPHMRNRDKKSPLQVAIDRGYSDIVKSLRPKQGSPSDSMDVS